MGGECVKSISVADLIETIVFLYVLMSRLCTSL